MVPDKIKIGSINYKVLKTEETLVLNCRECVGTIDYENAEIKLNIKRDPQVIEKTFWHEVIHGIAHDRNIEITEEMVIELENGIYQVLKDNEYI